MELLLCTRHVPVVERTTPPRCERNGRGETGRESSLFRRGLYAPLYGARSGDAVFADMRADRCRHRPSQIVDRRQVAVTEREVSGLL